MARAMSSSIRRRCFQLRHSVLYTIWSRLPRSMYSSTTLKHVMSPWLGSMLAPSTCMPSMGGAGGGDSSRRVAVLIEGRYALGLLARLADILQGWGC